ncbi:MAG: four-carbon acid sugar kinase family protein [Rhodospirillaceae bacterium]
MTPASAMRLRLVADDLTGALDTAARFAADAPVPVYWEPPRAVAGAVAIDSGTREMPREAARARVAAIAAALPKDPDALFYAKLDSLLRGHAAAEIAAWIGALRPAACLIAPAFPYQGRITRDARQIARDGDAWAPVPADLAADLADEGLIVQRRRAGETAPTGISLWDAETDADLAAIAAAGRALPGPVLWCGSGGLAAALAGSAPADGGLPAALPRPLLGLFGTDHPATAAQLAACGAPVIPPSAGDVAARLFSEGLALVRSSLPAGLSRETAARRIAAAFADLANHLPPPATLLVSGGETLRALCGALAARRLDLTGQILPGIPRAVLRGGRWDGVGVVSKSGAFGAPELLRDLLFPTPKRKEASR